MDGSIDLAVWGGGGVEGWVGTGSQLYGAAFCGGKWEGGRVHGVCELEGYERL